MDTGIVVLVIALFFATFAACATTAWTVFWLCRLALRRPFYIVESYSKAREDKDVKQVLRIPSAFENEAAARKVPEAAAPLDEGMVTVGERFD